jgi:hypothetical protein
MPLPPKPLRERVTRPVVSMPKPPPPPPIVVIPRRERVDPLSEPWKLRPAKRFHV